MEHTITIPPKSVTFAGVLIPLVLILLVFHYFRRAEKRLPGPRFALPLIGNLHQLGTKPHLTFLKWKKKYGPMYMIKMANQHTVILNDVKILKEFMPTSVASGRPQNPFWWVASNANHGVLFSSGRNWEEQRAFTIKTLSELGLSKGGKLEGIIVDEALTILRYFESKIGLPFCATRIFNGAVVSSLWTIMSGEKVDWMRDGKLEEPELIKLAGDMMMGFNNGLKTGLTSVPWLRFFPVGRSIWKNFISTVKIFQQLLDESAEKHAATLDTCSPRDFIDYSLSKIQSTSNPASSFYKETGRLNLQTTMSDVFLAGSETTSTALEYSMLYLGSCLSVQTRMQEELDKILGSRSPSLSERASLPYTQAVILEILRRSSVVAILGRRILEDVTLQGYHLPKDTMMFIDIFSILRDSAIWGKDVDDFNPNRFLNEDQSEVIHHEAFMEFGSGRRKCIGESLAMDTMFLFVTHIFQKFTVEVVVPHGGSIDFDKVETGFTLEPHPFEICVSRRNQNP